MKIRASFPKVYKLDDAKTGNPYFLVDCRSRKWGMDERKSFPSEKDALDYARQIAEQVAKHGARPTVPREVKIQSDAYAKLAERLTPFGKNPEDAVEHYIKFLGEDTIRKALPPIVDLADKWETFKKTDTTLSKPMVRDIGSYARFIRRTWGNMRPDEPKRNQIDLVIREKKNVTNNTRRKYLKFVRMFFAWVLDEGYITKNPTDGIFYKPEGFSGDFYSVETTKQLLQYVATHEKDLIGYYILLTFAGLRPTEGARVQWKDFSFQTNELFVRKGKTLARHIILEPVAIKWMQWHKNNTQKNSPFVQLKALSNREKRIRESVLNGAWIQDGLRHGFATYFKNLKKSIALTSDYMGNSPDVVRRHYARTIPAADVKAFWKLTPAVVLAN